LLIITLDRLSIADVVTRRFHGLESEKGRLSARANADESAAVGPAGAAAVSAAVPVAGVVAVPPGVAVVAVDFGEISRTGTVVVCVDALSEPPVSPQPAITAAMSAKAQSDHGPRRRLLLPHCSCPMRRARLLRRTKFWQIYTFERGRRRISGASDEFESDRRS
jgi:hypothetical protein